MKQKWLVLLSLFFTLSLQAADHNELPEYTFEQSTAAREAWKARDRAVSQESNSSLNFGTDKTTLRRRPGPVPTAPPQSFIPGAINSPSYSAGSRDSGLRSSSSLSATFSFPDQNGALIAQQQQEIAQLQAALQQQLQQPRARGGAETLEIAVQTGEHSLPPEVQDLLTRLRAEFAKHVAASDRIKTTAENLIADRARKQTQQQPPHKWKRPFESTEHHQSRERAALEELRRNSTGRIAALVHTLHTTNKAFDKSTEK